MSDEAGSADAGNPDAGQGNPVPENNDAAAAPQNWADAQYDEVIAAKGWDGADDVLQSYANLESMVGADKVVLPAADTSILDWEGWGALGVPDDAADYKLAAPDGMANYDENLSNDMRSIFHEAKLTPEQAQFVHDKYVERFGNQVDMNSAAQTQQLESWDKELHQEYGVAFDERIAAARMAVREFGGQELADFMDETGMGSHPLVVRTFVKAGMALGQHGQFKEGSSNSFGVTPADAKAQIAALRANPALMDSKHPEHKVMNEKLTSLYELANPDDGSGSNIVATVG
jgi:hypothetical protein